MCTVHEFQVIWNDDLKWNWTKRFSKFHEVAEQLKLGLKHIGNFEIPKLTKGMLSKVLKSNGEFEEARKGELQMFFDVCLRVNAVCFNHLFLEFIGATKNVDPLLLSRPLPLPKMALPVNISPDVLPVNSMCYDPGHSILVVGFGLRKSFMLGSKNKVRGVLNVYKVPSPNIMLPVQMPNCTKYFNEGVVSVAFDFRRRCICAGLATGPIMLFHVPLGGDELRYVSELDVHKNNLLLSPMHIDSFDDTLASVSSAGSLCVYSLKDGEVKSQMQMMKGLTSVVTSCAYDASDRLVVVGTEGIGGGGSGGDIIVFDVENRKPVELIRTPVARTETNVGIRAPVMIDYVRELRLAAAGFSNKVILYLIPSRNQMKSDFVMSPLATFLLRDGEIVCNVKFIESGHYVAATTVAGDTVVFDVQDPVSNAENDVDVAVLLESLQMSGTVSSASAGLSNALSSTVAGLVPWNEVIKGSNARIRDWLRAKGISVENACARCDLIDCVRSTVADSTALSTALAALPDKLRMTCLFAWQLNDMPTGAGRPRWRSKEAFVRCSCVIGDLRVVAFGCLDGGIRVMSLQSFLTPQDEWETNQRRAAYKATSRNASTPEKFITGSKKATRGSKHMLSSLPPLAAQGQADPEGDNSEGDAGCATAGSGGVPVSRGINRQMSVGSKTMYREGYMRKKSPKAVGSLGWQRRYCVLSANSTFSYYGKVRLV